MLDLKLFISKKMQGEFSRSLDMLRKETGSIPISKHSFDYGVAGNTFRAYVGWRKRPSEIYRLWAKPATESLALTQIKKYCSNRKAFLGWHSNLFNSLQGVWKKEQGSCLSVAHGYKLVDLYVRWLSKHSFGDASVSRLIEENANCAIDKQVLRKINQCYSDALPFGNPSMGNVTHKNTYLFCQALITEFVSGCGGTRLLFDRFAYKRGNGY